MHPAIVVAFQQCYAGRFLPRLRQPALQGHCGEGPRPQVADILVNELFLGIDPMLEPVPDVGERIYPEMTSVTDKDVDMVLFSAAQPVTFWLELGSMVARCIKRNFGVQLS